MDSLLDVLCDSNHEQLKKILDANHNLLVNNIVSADQTYDAFATARILPKFYVDDIKTMGSQTEKNESLLKGFRRRNVDLSKVCDVLQETGHNLLATHMRKEISHKATLVTKEDVLQNFPKIEQLVPIRRDRESFVNYLVEKFKEAEIINNLKNEHMRSPDSDGDANWTEVGEVKKLITEIKEKNIIIEDLTGQLKLANGGQDSKYGLDTEYALVDPEVVDEAGISERYTQALDSSLIRENARRKEQERKLTESLGKLEVVFKELNIDISNAGKDDAFSLTVYDKTVHAIGQLCRKAAELKETVDDFDELQRDVNAALSYLHQKRDKNIFNAVQEADEDFQQQLSKLQNDLRLLQREIEFFEDSKSSVPKSAADSHEVMSSNTSRRKSTQPSFRKEEYVHRAKRSQGNSKTTSNESLALVPASKQQKGKSNAGAYSGESTKQSSVTSSQDSNVEWLVSSEEIHEFEETVKYSAEKITMEYTDSPNTSSYSSDASTSSRNHLRMKNPTSVVKPTGRILAKPDGSRDTKGLQQKGMIKKGMNSKKIDIGINSYTRMSRNAKMAVYNNVKRKAEDRNN